MTRITIDLDDDEVRAARHWYASADEQPNSPIHRLQAKVYQALPPVRIEPKAGGTCRLREPQHVNGQDVQSVYRILYIDDLRVLIVTLSAEDTGCGGVMYRDFFDEKWEVLS